MHHARAARLADDSFRALAHPSRLSGGAFCTGLGLCRDEFLPDARTSWGDCSFGMNRADPLPSSRWGLRPFVVESSPPAAAEVQTPHCPEPPDPSRAQNREQHTCMRGARGPCMHASHPHRPAPPLQPQMPPRNRISLHSAAHHKARRKPPPTFVPRTAPPCRQIMNLDSVVAYDSRTN